MQELLPLILDEDSTAIVARSTSNMREASISVTWRVKEVEGRRVGRRNDTYDLLAAIALSLFGTFKKSFSTSSEEGICSCLCPLKMY